MSERSTSELRPAPPLSYAVSYISKREHCILDVKERHRS